MIVEAFQNMFAGISFDGSNPRDPAIARLLGMGRQSAAGVTVTPGEILALPAVKRAVEIITNKVCKIPQWRVYREHEQLARQPDRDHPAWTCVTDKANPDLSAVELRVQLTQWALIFGNGCAAIYREDRTQGGPIELIPLLPDRTSLVRVGADFAQKHDMNDMAGRLMYRTRIGEEWVHFMKSDVIHIRGLGESQYWGTDNSQALVEAYGGVLAKEQFANKLFGQGATPAGFITYDGQLEEEAEENFIQSIGKAIHGLGNAHKMILLEDGMKFQPVSFDPEKSQMLESREFDVRMIANAIGIKPHKLIDTANSAFASLEQANREHIEDDILPWITSWRSEYSRKLLRDDEQSTHCVDAVTKELNHVAFADRTRGTVEMLNNGIVTLDEARKELDLPPSGSRRAKDHRIPSNIIFQDDAVMVPVGNQQQPDDSEDQDRGEIGACSVSVTRLQLAVDELKQNHLSKLCKRLSKLATTKAAAGSKEFLAWLDNLKPEAGPESIQADINATYLRCIEVCNRIADTALNESQLLDLVKQMDLEP